MTASEHEVSLTGATPINKCEIETMAPPNYAWIYEIRIAPTELSDRSFSRLIYADVTVQSSYFESNIAQATAGAAGAAPPALKLNEDTTDNSL